ncbi:hypothetical protein BC936DRAFT_145205 [Jimgerdemannia flammicorona]|uniref:Uncharacterized protein n=1 Tax=Jimgerdemannia flammicorona TaxID=994334 RepID=A0A433DAP4_9FUNG|nr:hypothetical protein BC936DRAFT_145205 [Jimgerdemannia flammicorona]
MRASRSAAAFGSVRYATSAARDVDALGDNLPLIGLLDNHAGPVDLVSCAGVLVELVLKLVLTGDDGGEISLDDALCGGGNEDGLAVARGVVEAPDGVAGLLAAGVVVEDLADRKVEEVLDGALGGVLGGVAVVLVDVKRGEAVTARSGTPLDVVGRNAVKAVPVRGSERLEVGKGRGGRLEVEDLDG